MMNRMSFSETVFLFILALVIFGPKRLPEIARQVGKYMNEFRRASNEFKAQIEQEIAHLEVQKPTILPPSPTPVGATSRTLSSTTTTEASAPEASAPESPAPAAASEDEPLFATNNASTETPAAPTVTTSTTQESHV